MKRAKSCFLVIIMMVTIVSVPITAAASEPVSLSVSNATSAAGEDVVIDISISALSHLGASSFFLNFDNTKLTFKSVVVGSATAGGNVSINEDYEVNGNITTIYEGFIHEDGIIVSGSMLTVTFTVISGWAGSTPLTLTVGDFCDSAENQLAYTIQNGSVTVPVPQYTITFNANGGTGGEVKTLAYGATLIAPTVTRAGYTFIGWSPIVPETVPAANTTYTAQWDKNTYRLSFNANGGTGSMDYYTVYFEDGVTVPACAFTRTGYAFSGWNTAPNGSGTSVAVGTILYLTYDMTLFAQWIEITTPISGSGCVIDKVNKYIYGLAPAIKSLSAYVNVLEGYEISYVTSPSGFGTGTIVNITKDGTIVESYTVIIFGDVNGDGNIDSMDAGTIVDIENNAIQWNTITDAAFIKAGNVNGDVTIDSLDAGIVVDFENGKVKINQSTGVYIP